MPTPDDTDPQKRKQEYYHQQRLRDEAGASANNVQAQQELKKIEGKLGNTGKTLEKNRLAKVERGTGENQIPPGEQALNVAMALAGPEKLGFDAAKPALEYAGKAVLEKAGGLGQLLKGFLSGKAEHEASQAAEQTAQQVGSKIEKGDPSKGFHGNTLKGTTTNKPSLTAKAKFAGNAKPKPRAEGPAKPPPVGKVLKNDPAKGPTGKTLKGTTTSKPSLTAKAKASQKVAEKPKTKSAPAKQDAHRPGAEKPAAKPKAQGEKPPSASKKPRTKKATNSENPTPKVEDKAKTPRKVTGKVPAKSNRILTSGQVYKGAKTSTRKAGGDAVRMPDGPRRKVTGNKPYHYSDERKGGINHPSNRNYEKSRKGKLEPYEDVDYQYSSSGQGQATQKFLKERHKSGDYSGTVHSGGRLVGKRPGKKPHRGKGRDIP